MKVTLINHPGLKVVEGIQIQSPSPSIGLAYIGAYLKKHGHDYKAIDGCGEAMDQIRPYKKDSSVLIQGLSDEEILERIPSDSKLIGFSCLFSQCWPLVNRLAEKVRYHFPSAVLVTGGEHPSALPDPILRSKIFDLVVTGEGEETFREIADRIREGQDWYGLHGTLHLNVQGQIQKNPARKRVTDVDSFPYPDWDAWSLRAYIDREQVTGIRMGRQMPILGSRGCPFQCTFCSNDAMWTQRYLMRSAKLLVDEMEFMKDKYQVTGFTFMDSTFIVNRQKVMAFCEELINRRLHITYQIPAGTRCEAFSPQLVTLLEKSGLKNFAFAPESGDEKILKIIKKNIEIPKFVEAVRYSLKSKMTIACFIVIGFPEDTRKTLKNTMSLIRRLAFMGVHDVTVSKFTPYPGSELYEKFRKQGRVTEDFANFEGMTNFFSDEYESYCDSLSSKELHRTMFWMFLNFYILSGILRPWRVIKHLIAYFKNGVEQARYIRVIDELIRQRRNKWIVSP